MEDIIKALQIFLKYGNPEWPTHCEQDVIHIRGINIDNVSEEDKKELDKLGFILGDYSDDGFYSFRFGSA